MVTLRDEFDVDSSFYGAQIGANLTMDFDRVRLKFVPRVSLGASVLDADISGQAVGIDLTTETVFASVGTGFYTHVNNVGNWDESKFAVVPELDVGMEVRIVKNLSFNAGGWLKYWSCVARASQQVDRRLDRRGIGIVAEYEPDADILSPRFHFDTDDLLSYGFRAGFKVKF
jgi:hypothetical protein